MIRMAFLVLIFISSSPVIKEILGLRERGKAPCAYVVKQLDTKVSEVERKITDLNQLKSDLLQLQAEAARLPLINIEAQSCVCHLIEYQQLLALGEI